MKSPRSGFRRAAAASWALAGIGVAGVAGASALAYGDTLKPVADAVPQTAEPSADIAVSGPPAPPVELPQAPVTPEPAAPAPVRQAVAPEQTYLPQQTAAPEPAAPRYAQTYAPQPAYTPPPSYTAQPTYVAPAPVAPAPVQASTGVVGGSPSTVMGGSSTYTGGGSSSTTTTRRVPLGGGSGPNKAVPRTVSKGS